MCLSKYEVVLYTIFVQGTRRGGGPVGEVKKYCEHIMFIYVKYTGSYSVMQSGLGSSTVLVLGTCT